MKKLNNKGFGLIEGLLIIIALALVVGVGYYVYNSNKKVSNTPSQLNSNTSKNSQQNNNSESKNNDTIKSSESSITKTDEELIIESMKAYGLPSKQNDGSTIANIKVSEITGNNANGTANAQDANGKDIQLSSFGFIAHKDNDKWLIIYVGQQIPGEEIGIKYGLPSNWYYHE